MSLITGGNATMVPCVTNASASLSVAPTSGGGGGGGGGGGPNLFVSTLTFPVGNQVSQGVIVMASTLTINDLATPVGQDYIFQTNNPSQAAIQPYVSSVINKLYVNGSGGNADNGSFMLGSGADGRSILWASAGGATTSTLSIVADTVSIPNNLNVSSINGQAPGGGAISTFSQLFTSSISALNPMTTLLTIAGANNNSMAYNLSSDASLVFSSGGFNTQISGRAEGGNPLITIGGPDGGNVVNVSISSIISANINVSSINGLIPGVAAAGISTNQVAAATGTQLFLKGGADATNINIDSSASSVTMNANNTYIGGTLNVTNSTVTSNIVPSGIASAVNIPRAQISTINANAFGASPITNFFNWTAYGTVQNGFGVYNGKLTGIGGGGGAYNSTFQLAPIVNFTNTNAMTAFVVSASVGSGTMNDLAVSCVGVSSVQVTGTVAGTVNDLSFYVAGPADGLF